MALERSEFRILFKRLEKAGVDFRLEALVLEHSYQQR